MNRILILFHLVVLCPFLKSYGQELPQRKMIVVIDPGHGGKDPGAIGIDGIQEKDITLLMAKRLVKHYQKTGDNKLEIYLTRYSDSLILLKDRARLAIALKADLFLSIHCNWSINTSANGVEAFVPYPGNRSYANIRTSISLALDLILRLSKEYELKSRGVKFANFQVLQEAVVQCPSVLLEVGFLTNPEDIDDFLNPAYITTLINILNNNDEAALFKNMVYTTSAYYCCYFRNKKFNY